MVPTKQCSNIFNIVFTFSAMKPDVADVLSMICSSLLCCLAPRFIISVRELYYRDLRGFRQGIDTGFGVLSQGRSGEDGRISTILFADAAEDESRTRHRDEDGQGGTQLGVAEENLHQV